MNCQLLPFTLSYQKAIVIGRNSENESSEMGRAINLDALRPK